ncbi:ribonuclease 2-like [Bidens hawaiensis]|uniref:ribonuclease 2-like n=1 Tax=Bidens hawaiensis TaxID=980011 RepID=UPI00404B8537
MLDRVGPCLLSKYGTCAGPVTGDEYEYFLSSLEVYLRHNVTDVLSEAGYVPSDTIKYASSGIISAIKKGFNATPNLACKNGAIEEVRLCFTKDFKLRDCVEETDCPDIVSFPKFKFPDVSKTKAWSLLAGLTPS